MITVTLRPPDDRQYRAWHDAAVEGYARDRAVVDRVAPDVALAAARRSFAELLPDGPATAGHHILAVAADDRPEPIGMVWLAERGTGPDREGFVYDIVIRADLRGRGYGTAALTALESFARSLGLSRIALHAFGHNEGAVRLYMRQGYRVDDVLMHKDIAPGT